MLKSRQFNVDNNFEKWYDGDNDGFIVDPDGELVDAGFRFLLFMDLNAK